jgi:Spy/CpxP family protein refolding chaperone
LRFYAPVRKTSPQVGEEAEQTNHQKQIDSTKALDELLKSGKASESEIYAKIEEYKEKFADYGRDRRSAMEFHLKNVERLLMPTQTTSFIMNTLKDSGGGNNNNSSNSNNSNNNASTAGAPPPRAPASSPENAPPKTSKELFTLLVKKLEVTPAQAAALKDSRFVSQEMDETLKETLTVLKELRVRLAQCGQDLETEFHCIRQILTPSQSAKFLVWVARNKACMHMLNELWSKNYPSMSKATTTETDGGSPSDTSTTLQKSPNGSFDE